MPDVETAAKPVVRSALDTDRFIKQAKKVAVDNFNANRDTQFSAPLTVRDVYIESFTKIMGNWQAIVGSDVARGMLWSVTYNSYKKEVYVSAYKRLKSVKIAVGETT
jgi:hypothetical protein